MRALTALCVLTLVGLSLCAEIDHGDHGHGDHAAVKEGGDATDAAAKKYSGSWTEGFVASWFMILVSEIGDKTFFIACLMAMRNDRTVVFFGAMSALSAMTILSAGIGHIVPTILPVQYTQVAAVVLFTGFGLKLLYEARTMDDEDEEPEELTEAQAELAKKEEDYADIDIEKGTQDVPIKKTPPAIGSTAASIFGPVFVQAFTLTFVAEWGDRSQIATIAFAAAKNPYGVTLGGIFGHSICTGSAVMIGKSVANTFTPRHVTLLGGVLFIFFGLLTGYQLVYPTEHAPVIV
eukprot:TRINITY_DN19317_c0_g1_i1.p1 TRINITY_DN19317_c0_g1~~TRINITY_DN19317_c0_g1_i1.p1  ORF type:complete len:292 (+),score=91.13 TRINITY_DN19317_c0_g1_i1:46-921(+)